MSLRFVRNDEIVAATLEPGHRAYEIRDDADRLLGVVASGSSDRGTVWTAGRVGPTRSHPFVGCVQAETRAGAVARLVGGQP